MFFISFDSYYNFGLMDRLGQGTFGGFLPAATAVVDWAAMASDRSSSSDNDARVVAFPRGRTAARWRAKIPSPVDDLAKYERGEAVDDYRHRMTVNAAAFVVVLLLIGAGLWLAETMAELRKNEDCVLSGRHNCSPVEVNNSRW